MERAKKVLTALLICSMCLGNVVPVMAEGDNVSNSDSQEQDSQDNEQVNVDTVGNEDTGTEEYAISEQKLLSNSGDGTLVTNMPEGEQIYITLADNWDYRWNANDSGGLNSVIHLDDYTGSNCNFQLYRVSEDGKQTDYYGISYEGSKRFADIDGKSKKDGAVLHLYESSNGTNPVKKHDGNPHRQFAFYYVKTDDYGNQYYYIQNKNSGLWMGYEDTDNNGGPSCGDKIWQTSKENRKLWVVTNCVVPKQGGEVEDLIAYKEGSTTQREDGVFVSLFKKDTIECVTSYLDSAVNFTNLNFYRMGTNSKMLLKWDEKHSAYEIHYYTDGENDRGAVWDVEGEGTQENADVHLWDCQSKEKNENTSQLWRFFKQSDGSYKIQNAKTGKFIAYQYDKDDEDDEDRKSSGTLKQLDGSEGTFDDKVRKLAYFTIDRFGGTDNPVNFNYSVDWMANIPDDALLSSVNIPGTHDTGTASVNFDASGQASLSSCQKYFYGEQLNVGARSFDVRCDATKDDASLEDVKIIHGNLLTVCHERGTDFKTLTLKSILDDSVRFLKNHPSEALVIMIKKDAGSDIGLTSAMASFIKNNKEYVWTEVRIPTMGEARGKIVFVRRYDISDYDYAKDGLEPYWFGISLTNWDDNQYSDYTYAIPIYNYEDKEIVYVQDAYNEGSSGKIEHIEGTLKQTVGEDSAHEISKNSWIYNYTSCASGFPLGLTRDINPWMYNGNGSKYFDNRRLGMVMLNFVDGQMSKLVYETNFREGNFFELKSSPPEVTLTYGDTLGEAELNGGTGNGTWSFDDPNIKPSYHDYVTGTEYTMTFTPYDTDHYRTVSAKVKITNFKKKPVVVTVDDKEMTYGDDTIPEFTYTFDESQLEEGDMVDSLGITMRINPLSSSTGRLRAGTYAITSTSDSNIYDVQFTKDETGRNAGSLTVCRRNLGIQWSDTKNLKYTGNPVNVTATITGVLEGDDCYVEVTGGNKIGPSWNGDVNTPPTQYTATAEVKGDDRLNYKLPKDDDVYEYKTSINYYIRRSDPNTDDYAFPTKAVMTYGQKLSEATLVGASGEGEFVFVGKDTNGNIQRLDDTVPAAGEQEYYIAYIPVDKTLEHATVSDSKIPVTVSKKTVTVKAEAKEKRYGDTMNQSDLTYTIDADQLVGSDTKADLALTLTAGDGNNQFCDVGQYQIVKKDCESSNYEVTVIPAYLTVSKRKVGIEWNGQAQYTYSGSPVNITAQVDLPDTWPEERKEECKVVVIGGKRTDAGSYNAMAIALSNRSNYMFADSAQKTFAYTITKADPSGITFPTSATITYGQTLQQAVFEGGSCEVPGEFVFADNPAGFLAVGSNTEYSVKFVPDDTKNYNTVDGNDKVPVTVNPKSLTVGAYNQYKTYGDNTPTLTWYMDESQLVGNDSAAEFDFELTAGDGNDKYCDVGGYSIKIAENGIKNQNPNYTINYINGTLKVNPLEVEIQWSSTTNIKVGDSGPSATISNLVNNDECQVIVEYTEGTGPKGTDKPSWTIELDEPQRFDATITGIEGDKKFNYTLPEDDLQIQYFVRRADATDYRMPEGAVMIYGQKLSEARLILASGEGEFKFVENRLSTGDINDTVPDSAGKHTYMVKFIPDDINEAPVFKEISVMVRPKQITVNALSGEKTYGEKTVLDFKMDETQLVLDDTKEDLKLTLTAVSTLGEEQPDGDRTNSSAGIYEVRKKECKNSNYNVTVLPAEFCIRQKEVSLTWSDVSNLVYTGKPVNVTAKAEGILDGEQCIVNVINGDKVQPGTYVAQAVSLSNSNYALPGDYNQLTKEYTIQEADNTDGGSSGSGNSLVGNDSHRNDDKLSNGITFQEAKDTGEGGSDTDGGSSDSDDGLDSNDSHKNDDKVSNTSDSIAMKYIVFIALPVVSAGAASIVMLRKKRHMK